VPKHSLFVVGNVGYRSFALEWRSLVLGAPVTNESSYSFYDVSEQLKTTTNAAERQDLLRQFRILLDQADRLSARNHSMAKSLAASEEPECR
jgi:hypothetical protein